MHLILFFFILYTCANHLICISTLHSYIRCLHTISMYKRYYGLFSSLQKKPFASCHSFCLVWKITSTERDDPSQLTQSHNYISFQFQCFWITTCDMLHSAYCQSPDTNRSLCQEINVISPNRLCHFHVFFLYFVALLITTVYIRSFWNKSEKITDKKAGILICKHVKMLVFAFKGTIQSNYTTFCPLVLEWVNNTSINTEIKGKQVASLF